MHRSLPLSFRALPLLLMVIASFQVAAQNYAGHNWYFGNSNLAIRFNRADNLPTLLNNKAIPFGTGGSAVATDPVNGNLLFYTDGANIYDATHLLMPAGGGLTANTAGNQPVAIAKAPGQKTQYYVFMNSANYTTGGTVSYRVVDMALFGNAVFPRPALGDATGGNVAIAGLTGRSEAMITIPHANGEDFWLITHANGAPDYIVTPFTATGPGTSIAITNLGLIDVAANFAYHPASGRIAVSPQEDTRDIEILRFNNATGALTFGQTVLNTAVQSTGPQAIYDVEWSNNGQYLYVSRHGEAGIQADVMQYDLSSNFSTLTSVLPPPTPPATPIFRSYGLQMGPDSVIYHLYQAASGGPFLLGALTNTDTVASEVNYDPSAFTANPNFNGTQFSTFAPKDTVKLTVSFTSQGTCSGAPTSFFPTVSPGADSLVWDFGDGSGSNAWSPVYAYQDGGAYNVRVRAYLKGDTASFTQTVNITQFDLQLNLVQDTTACVCELPVNNGKPTANPSVTCPNDTSDDMQVTVQAQGGSPTFQWFGPGGMLTGQTTATLRPDSAGYYYVVATMAGCSAYAGVNIKEYDSLDQRANIWYFGQNAGIDFNGLPDDPAVAITGPLNTPEGTAVISDRNGQVIFSTDGQKIYDKDDNEIVLPAPGLGGENQSTQSSLIIPVPGDETLYYIFTTQQVDDVAPYELRYSLFDLKLNNGQGGLRQFNQLLFSGSTERITGNDNWLIAHEYGNNSFRAYRIGQDGIGNPVVSAIGSDHQTSIAEQGQGYMELGAQNRLAVALSTPGVSNVVEIFDFIDSTGVVTNFRTADLKSPTGQVYGLEISPGGNKLFATLSNAGSQMYEFAFDTLGIPHLKQQVSHTGELGAMQIGPDGQIYVAINGSSSLGTFTANEDTTQLSAITTLQPFALAGGTQSLKGLPNFTQIISNPTQTPGFSFTGLCLGDSTQFSATGKDAAIDKFDWFFGDGQAQADGGAQIAHLYSAPGTYTVNVRIYNKCEEVGTFTETVIINDVPPDPSRGVALCTGGAVLDANPTDLPDLTYEWDDGQTTETITANVQGNYLVTVTDKNGCSTDGTFLAVDNRPRVQFGPDPTICQNVPIAPLNAQNPGATYAWELNDAANGNVAQTQSVNTSAPGVFEYKVTITDPVTTCFAIDSITYTINPSPVFTATGSTIACGATNGQIGLNITAPATSLFSYFVTGPSTVSDTDRSVGAITLTSPPNAFAAGTYGVSVSDQVSGCATTTTVSIINNAFTVNPVTPTATCDPIRLNVTVNPTPGPLVFPLTYRVIDNANPGTPAETGTTATANFQTTAALPSNNRQYVVEVRDNGGCLATSSAVTVNEAATVQPTFTTNTCTNPISLTANGGTGWMWTGPGISPTATQTVQILNAPQGLQTYNVRITDATLCALDTFLTVNVENNVTATITPTDPCANQVTLTAAPAGNYTYRWYRNGTMLPGGGGRQIVIGTADNGAQYRVEVVSTLSGCVFPSTPVTANVAGNVTVDITSTTPCEGSPFTLTATTTPATGAAMQWALNGTVIPGQTTTTLIDTRAGNYVATATISGCSVTDAFNIVLAPVTAGLLNDTGIICPDPANPDITTREVVLNPGANFTSYDWFKEEVSIGVTTQTYTATEAGLYSVNLINSYGCPSSDKTELMEECDPRLTGPNAFRPSSTVSEAGEFSNRDFKLFSFFIADTDFQVFIFNRWGEMVYQSNERLFRWNGGYNNNLGQPLPPGTYTYVVRFKSSYRPEEGIQERRGGVVLLR
ncbi:gliding motility-associated C-terminal domain-containing protein [Fulvivirgaceae bacterium PWU4]|uniref:Gliding motility-associated C-terminal domain-containing protein n=1 Tax=Chryseosolibacter histidini TaxID=2782349 RepID=A0AAP2GL25_9BACT|nr:PKD domain-containing protein [Chryseosolibacter histidini]MBT1699669.1 gliding motility-associated C-terminal domain-containing protein [Chryseosolibacter histidini]